LFGIMGCWASVPQSSVGMVERFGKFRREAHPGLNPLCCCLGEAVHGYVSQRVQQLDVTCETKTKDNVFVDVVVSVQYQVIAQNTFDAYYKLTDPHTQIKAYVYDVVRASVPKIVLDEVFETKEEIAHSVREELEKSMNEYGFQIIQTLITDIRPDEKVKRAMNDINAAQRLRAAATDKAEAEKIMVVKAAEADAESKYLAGMGISRQRRAIVEGLRDCARVHARSGRRGHQGRHGSRSHHPILRHFEGDRSARRRKHDLHSSFSWGYRKYCRSNPNRRPSGECTFITQTKDPQGEAEGRLKPQVREVVPIVTMFFPLIKKKAKPPTH